MDKTKELRDIVMNKIEWILCAAVRLDKKYGDLIIPGFRHNNCIDLVIMIDHKIKVTQVMQGFLTSKKRFVNRKEAGIIAHKAGQINNPTDLLLSEDLY